MIRLVWKPRITVVARMTIDHVAVAQFLEPHGFEAFRSDALTDADALPELGGRVCYMSFGKKRRSGNTEYIKNIIESGHGSVTEHTVFGLIVDGISRRCGEQFTRQRVGFSPSQLSQRYVDESAPRFVVPPPIRLAEGITPFHEWDTRTTPEPHWFRDGSMAPAFRDWAYSIQLCQNTYKRLCEDFYVDNPSVPDKTLRRKRAREAARSVLPNATETILYCTMNARAIRHFIEMRSSSSADAEIRTVAREMLKTMWNESPNLFVDYEDRWTDDEWTAWTPHPKV